MALNEILSCRIIIPTFGPIRFHFTRYAKLGKTKRHSVWHLEENKKRRRVAAGIRAQVSTATTWNSYH
jgi:hypothetical protein